MNLIILTVINPSRPYDEAALLSSHTGFDKLLNYTFPFRGINREEFRNLFLPLHECISLFTVGNRSQLIANLGLGVGLCNASGKSSYACA